jgi:hypothetical protein
VDDAILIRHHEVHAVLSVRYLLVSVLVEEASDLTPVDELQGELSSGRRPKGDGAAVMR